MNQAGTGGAPAAASISFELLRLRSIHRTAPYFLVLSVFSVVTITTQLAGTLPAPLLAAWLGGSLLLAAVLGLDLRRTGSALAEEDRMRAWENRLAAGLLIQGILWLWLFSGGAEIQPAARPPVQIFAFAAAFTASVVFGASLRCYLALVPLVAGGQLIWMAAAGQPGPGQAAFIVLLYVTLLATCLTLFRRVLLAGIATDLTRRHLLAEREALLNHSLTGTAQIRDEKFVRVNSEFCRIYGIAKAELEGASTRIIYLDDEAWQKAVAPGRAVFDSRHIAYEQEYRRPDGQRRHLSAQATRLPGDGTSPELLFTVVDITESRHAEMQLAARESAYRALAESYQIITAAAPALIWAADLDAKFTFVSERGSASILGVPAANAIGKRQIDLLLLPQVKQDVEAFSCLLRGEMLLDHVSEAVQPSGRKIFISSSGGPLRDADGKITGAAGISIDITERQQRAADLENARTLLMSAVDSMSDGFVVFGPDDRIVLCNQRYTAMLDGFDAGEPVTGLHVENLIRRQVAAGLPMPPEFAGSIEEWIAALLALHRRADGVPQIQQLSGGGWTQSIRHRTPDGSIVVLRSDITALKQSELAAQQLAQHDALTGLPNRRLLDDRLAQALARARRTSGMVAVLVIDLDGFKPVNDTHGHGAGDEVLRVTANRLKECVRAADTVARYGGDEFVVILDGLAQRADAGVVAAKIIEAVARPVQPPWASAQRLPDFQIGCSIGISLFPGDTKNPDALLRLADGAMYLAKEAGRGRFVYSSSPV